MKSLLFCLGFASMISVSIAQTSVSLLKDFNSSPQLNDHSFGKIVGNGNDIFFSDGGVVWKSDGTKAGTKPVYDVTNLQLPKEAYHLVQADNYVFFLGVADLDAHEPWRTDGTQAGTFKLKDICPGTCATGILSALANGNIVYFISRDFAGKVGIWKTDGTQANTTLIQEHIPTFTPYPLPEPVLMGVIDNNLFYFMNYQIWKTDGTPGGTAVFATDVMRSKPLMFKNELYFTALDPNNFYSLYKTNGTEISKVKDSNGNSIPADDNDFFRIAGDKLFLLNTGSIRITSGAETTPKVNIPANLNIIEAAAVNNAIYFTGESAENGLELYVSDGTEAGTKMFYESSPGPYSLNPDQLVSIGSKLFLRIYETLYKVENGVLSKMYEGKLEPDEVIAMGSNLYLSGRKIVQDQPVQGTELWKSDGTEAGLVQLTEPHGTAGTTIQFKLRREGKPYFTAYYSNRSENRWVIDLYTTDGTPGGTSLVVGDLSTVLRATAGPEEYILYQTADYSLNAIDEAGTKTQLAKDVRMYNLNAWEVVRWQDKVYFTSFYSGKRLLWVSDGTSSGTQLIDLSAKGINFISLSVLTPFDDAIYFAADDGVNGTELWKTDGTAEGTVMIKDLNPGPAASSPSSFAFVNGKISFRAYAESGFDMFVTDGTAAGTHRLMDAPPWGKGSYYGPVASMNGILYFVVSLTDKGLPLWRTDGTVDGTYSLMEQGDTFSAMSGHAVVNNTLFFLNHTELGTEMWKTDGTPEGTVIIEDIYVGDFPGAGSPMTVLNDALYFVGRDGTNGFELWKVDDEHCGAIRLTDNIGARPLVLSSVGNRLLMDAAADGVGQELFYYDISNDGLPKSEQTLELNLPLSISYKDIVEDLMTSSSSLSLDYLTSDPSIAVAHDNTVEFVGVGPVTITATQSGDASFCRASATFEVLVNKASQTITFEPFSATIFRDSTIDLSASATSGLPVLYLSQDSNIASIDGSRLAIKSVGTTTITATQAGNEYYNAAEDVPRTLTIHAITDVDPAFSELEVYPIPTGSYLYVKGGSLQYLTLSDLNSKILLQQSKPIGEEHLLDLSRLPAGIYILSINIQGRNIRHRILKK